MIFTHDKNIPITGELIAEFIEQHKLLLPKYIESKNMYEGNHAILFREAREVYKPDNRLVVNFAKKIVDTFNGYFIGVPVKITHENEKLQEIVNDFVNRNGLDDQDSELSKACSIYGHAYEYLYQDEETKTRVLAKTPLDTFVVYDESALGSRLFGITCFYDKEDKFVGELVDDTYRYDLVMNDKKQISLTNPIQHYYGGVPMVEYIENEERQCIFEGVKSLINAFNEALSAKADDVAYFGDAYLVVKGADLNEKTMEQLRSNKTINLAGDGTDKVVIEFLAKPNADETQENLLNRLTTLIYDTAMVTNTNDEFFSKAPSGVSLEFKLQDMNNMAINKERKFKRSMKRRFKLMFALISNVPTAQRDEWYNLGFLFTRNIPRNKLAEIEMAAKAEGIVSHKTQLEMISVVDDANAELELIEEENKAPLENQYDSQK